MIKKLLNFIQNNKFEAFIILLTIIIYSFRLITALQYGRATSSDDSIIPLMANHILHDHKFYIFYWGQPYMGVPEAYLMAFFGLFNGGVTEEIASFTMIFIYMICGIFSSYLLYRITKKYLYFAISLFVFSLGGYFVTPTDFGGYGVCLTLGSIMMLLGYIYIWEEKINYKVYYLLIGLLTGIGFWSHVMILDFILALVVLDALFVKRTLNIESIKKTTLSIIISGGSFFIGSSPFWIWNVKNHFNTIFGVFLGQFGQLQISRVEFIHHLPRTVEMFFGPMYNVLFLNAAIKTNSASPLYIAMSIIYFSAFAFVIIHLYNRKSEERIKHSPFIMYFLVMLFSFGFYAFSLTGYTDDIGSQYYTMMLIPIMTILAYFIGITYTKYPYLAVLFLMITFAVYGNNIPVNAVKNNGVDLVLTELKKQNVNTCFWDYWQSYELTLRSNENIICSPLLGPQRQDKYPPYTDTVLESPKAAFIIYTENNQEFVNMLKKLDIKNNYESKKIDIFTIYYPIEKQDYKLILKNWINISPGGYDHDWYVADRLKDTKTINN